MNGVASVAPSLAVAVAAAMVLLLSGGPAQAADPLPGTVAEASSGVDTSALPALARTSLPLITELTAHDCPELPPVWVVAQVQAESGWDPGLHAERPGGAAGLYQLGERNWEAAGGTAWAADPPAEGSDVMTAEAHLRIAIPWVCANLRAVTGHLKATGKPSTPLDAMLVCHIAGCGRVTGSRTGIPAAGEAGCGEQCAQIVRRYVAAVHENVARFTAKTTPDQPAPPAAPAPGVWTGGATGCRSPDPTSGGCVTGATLNGLDAVATAFGGWKAGPAVHDTGCWDRHAWNPRSDHPTGKACDFMVTTPGTFAKGTELRHGWEVAGWLRANAAPLQIKYLIWQGRYWDPRTRDDPGTWGARYTGGGVYDVTSATGGHFDHVHVSFRE